MLALHRWDDGLGYRSKGAGCLFSCLLGLNKVPLIHDIEEFLRSFQASNCMSNRRSGLVLANNSFLDLKVQLGGHTEVHQPLATGHLDQLEGPALNMFAHCLLGLWLVKPLWGWQPIGCELCRYSGFR